MDVCDTGADRLVTYVQAPAVHQPLIAPVSRHEEVAKTSPSRPGKWNSMALAWLICPSGHAD
jgi:hypothetical protein